MSLTLGKINQNKPRSMFPGILPSFTSLSQNLGQSTKLSRKPFAPHLCAFLALFSLWLSYLRCPPGAQKYQIYFFLLAEITSVSLCPFRASQEVMAWALPGGTPLSVGSVCCSALPSWKCHNKHTPGRGKIQDRLCPYISHGK